MNASIRFLLPFSLLVAFALAGCTSRQSVVQKYQREAQASEAAARSADAEGYHRSAVERSRKLGLAEQAEALLGLGAFLQRQLRFSESLAPLHESLAKAGDAIMPPSALAVRQLRLARSYGALDRWREGAAVLQAAMPSAKTLTGEDGQLARDVTEVYRARLPQLGMDAGFLD
jgi:hypothetical protein